MYKPGNHVIYHLSGTLLNTLSVKGGNSINYTGVNQNCPWHARTYGHSTEAVPDSFLTLPHLHQPQRGICSSCAFLLCTWPFSTSLLDERVFSLTDQLQGQCQSLYFHAPFIQHLLEYQHLFSIYFAFFRLWAPQGWGV